MSDASYPFRRYGSMRCLERDDGISATTGPHTLTPYDHTELEQTSRLTNIAGSVWRVCEDDILALVDAHGVDNERTTLSRFAPLVLATRRSSVQRPLGLLLPMTSLHTAPVSSLPNSHSHTVIGNRIPYMRIRNLKAGPMSSLFADLPPAGNCWQLQ
jgi:hypothetical protein